MSFVLEALKRSEHQRQVATVPTLGSYVLPMRRNAASPTVWIVAGLLFAAVTATAGWWLGTRRPATSTQASNMPNTAQPHVPSQEPRIGPTSKPKPAIDFQLARQSQPPLAIAGSRKIGDSRRPAPITVAAVDTGLQAPRAPSLMNQAPKPATTQTAPASVTTTPTAPLILALPSLAKKQEAAKADAGKSTSEVEPIAYSELPAAVKRALPSIELGGYAVSADGSALVAVNDQLLREGDEVAAGLAVEKILADGVIFRYHQYRFRR